MKKQIISLILCIGMILTLVPVFATTTETAPTVCNVLFEENFEDGSTSIAATSASGGTGSVQAVGETGSYGQSEKYYSVTGRNNPYGRFLFNSENKIISKSMLGGVHTESSDTYGYTVEFSFDWNPADENSTNPSSLISVGAVKDSNTDFTGFSFMGIRYIGGDTDDSKRTLSIHNRKLLDGGEIDSFKLEDKLGDEIWDLNHMYRVRIVLKPYTAKQTVDGSNYAGTFDVYIDGVHFKQYKYIHNATREIYIAGMLYRTNVDAPGVLDNIKIVEYWDALDANTEGVSSYINDDELVSAIRKWEYNLSSLEGAEQAKLSSALVEAKAAFEAENRTQATVDAAVTKLNDWQNQSEESEWSAEVSERAVRKVTIKANKEITDGKIIVANYSGSYVVNATLPEFTGLAAGKTMEITIPESWTGDVRVFFWDTEHNALMDCEKLTIE